MFDWYAMSVILIVIMIAVDYCSVVYDRDTDFGDIGETRS
jgi:hypothetical protein